VENGLVRTAIANPFVPEYQFSRETPNVVHMSVRPAEMMEEDEAAKGKSAGRDGRNREGSGNCCVIL
jgi:hypothetical protein